MRIEYERQLTKNMKNSGYSYGEISKILNISRSSVQNLCNYEKKIDKMKEDQGF